MRSRRLLHRRGASWTARGEGKARARAAPSNAKVTLVEESRKFRKGVNGIKACTLVARKVSTNFIHKLMGVGMLS